MASANLHLSELFMRCRRAQKGRETMLPLRWFAPRWCVRMLPSTGIFDCTHTWRHGRPEQARASSRKCPR